MLSLAYAIFRDSKTRELVVPKRSFFVYGNHQRHNAGAVDTPGGREIVGGFSGFGPGSPGVFAAFQTGSANLRRGSSRSLVDHGHFQYVGTILLGWGDPHVLSGAEIAG